MLLPNILTIDGTYLPKLMSIHIYSIYIYFV